METNHRQTVRDSFAYGLINDKPKPTVKGKAGDCQLTSEQIKTLRATDRDDTYYCPACGKDSLLINSALSIPLCMEGCTRESIHEALNKPKKKDKAFRQPRMTDSVCREQINEAYHKAIRFNKLKRVIELIEYNSAIPQWVPFNADRLAVDLSRYWEIDTSVDRIKRVVNSIAYDNQHCPVSHYLTSVGDRYSVEDLKQCWAELQRRLVLPYPEQFPILQRWLMHCVKRARVPGCKVDLCIILLGSQGIGKSSLLRGLGGNFFSDSSFNPRDKDSCVNALSHWIVELPELFFENAYHQSFYDGFITRQVDSYRLPYAATHEAYPRLTMFAATTNNRFIFSPDRGHRRYGVIDLEYIDYEWIRDNRDLIWAMAGYFQDTLGNTPEPDYHSLGVRYEAIDPWLDALSHVLGQSQVKLSQCYEALDIPPERRSRVTNERIVSTLKNNGFELKHTKSGNIWVK